MPVPESLRQQNELMASLRKQVQAVEHELADQKWVLDQYLKSPSWRLTAPLRWVARQIRALKQLILNLMGNPGASEHEWTPPSPPLPSETPLVEDGAGQADELKDLLASLYRTTLQAFLGSGNILDLPSASTPQVSVILVLYNRAELTLACLRALRETFAITLEVIIVDNASTDETAMLLGRIRGAKIIRNNENAHFLAAVNQAAHEAQGTHILLLNNDAQTLPGAIEAALFTLESDDSIGAVGGKILLLDGSLQEAGSITWKDGSCLGYGRGDNPLASPYMFQRDVDYCSGAFLLTRRSTWESLGGFDEAFHPAYYEETDFCLRLWEQGMRVVYEPGAVILHYEFASSQSTKAATDLQANHQRLFAERHIATLNGRPAQDPSAILFARTHARQRRILFMDDRVPHPWLGSGFPRARTILQALRKQGFFVTFFTMDPAALNEDWSIVYSDFPKDVEVINEMGPQLLEAFLRHRSDYYETIIVSRPHNMNYLVPILKTHPEWFQKLSLIYDAEALFAPREIAMRELQGEVLTLEDHEKVYETEIALAREADIVMAVSEMDRKAFLSHGIQRVHALGHTLEPTPTSTPFAQRTGFLFVGAIHDETSPNGDSMIWFLTEVWPTIKAALGPAATLIVAGVNKSVRLRKMAGPDIHILGHLEDITSLYASARVFIAPTRFAAGIPHKVHEAAAHGIPVVATPILAQQLNWKNGSELLVAADAGAFAKLCLELHENEVTWTRIRATALEAVRRDCSSNTFERHVLDVLAIQGSGKSRERYADARMDR